MNLFMTSTHFYIFVIDVVMGLVDIVLITRLYERVYGRCFISRKYLYLAALCIGLFTSIFLQLALAYYRPASIPPVTVIASLILLPFFHDAKRNKKVLFSYILFAASLFWTMAYDLLVSPMTTKIIWLAESACHIGFWPIFELIGYLGRKKRQTVPQTMWLLLFAISLSSTGLCTFLLYNTGLRDYPSDYTTEIWVMLVLLFINVMLFALYDRLAAFMESEQQRNLLEQQLVFQKEHYQQMELANNQIRMVHHDMKNHLNAALALSLSNDSHELERYLRDATGEIDKYEQTVTTGNPDMDAVLDMKIAELRHADISVTVDIHIPSELRLTFDHIITIFGNLLDNAKEACLKLPAGSRQVSIVLNYINDSLLITISNTVEEIITAWDNGLPATTKSNRTMHGLGLKNVRSKVEPIGSFHISSTAELFSVEVVLYDL